MSGGGEGSHRVFWEGGCGRVWRVPRDHCGAVDGPASGVHAARADVAHPLKGPARCTSDLRRRVFLIALDVRARRSAVTRVSLPKGSAAFSSPFPSPSCVISYH